MIKTDIRPGRFIMAAPAVVLRIILNADNSLVDIPVAVGTMQSDVFKAPFFLFFVTGNTRGGNMSSPEEEISQVMLIDGKN